MYSYIAIYRHGEIHNNIESWSLLKNNVERHLRCPIVIFENKNIIIYAEAEPKTSMSAHRLGNGGGIIFGHVFSPKPDGSSGVSSNRIENTISDQESEKILSTRGLRLLDNYWGSYVSILVRERNREIDVIRGPATTLPCFHYHYEGISIIFSDPNMVRVIKDKRPSVDWDFAANFLDRAYIQTEKTPIQNLIGLLPGQRLSIAMGKICVETVWEPASFYNKNSVESPSVLAKKMENITVSCLDAWSRTFNKGLIYLSGGFDSSLIAGCMSKLSVKPNIMCLTSYHDSSSVDDERNYARQTADFFGYNLFEMPIDSSDIGINIYDEFPVVPRPLNINPTWKSSLKRYEIAKENNIDVVITGDGGDGVFAAFGHNFSAIDYALDHPIGIDYFRFAINSSLLSGATMWKNLKFMVNAKFNREIIMNDKDQHDDDLSWGIEKNIYQKIQNVIPGMENSYFQKIPHPGKMAQIHDMTAPYHYYSPIPQIPFIETVRPLFSQPLMEFCLSIPYYTLQLGGRERGLARSAFRKYLTDEVRLRQFKSFGNSVVYKSIVENKEFFYDFLKGGVLHQKGFLNMDDLKVVVGSGELSPIRYLRVSHLASLEAWARTWI